MLLQDCYARVASRFPDKLAVAFAKRRLSFAELDRESAVVAAGLVRSGVRPGDRVAVLADHRAEAVVTFWAAIKAGAIAVNLNDQLSPEGLWDVLRDCEPAVIVSSEKYGREKLDRLPGRSTARRVILDGPDGNWSELLHDPGGDLDAWEAGAPDDPATIIYTSGSTGTPKGVSLSHRNLLTVVDGVIEHMPMRPDDSYLMVVPLHYVHGVMQLLVHQLVGAPIHFAGGFLFPKLVLQQIIDQQVTGFSGVPYHFAALMDRTNFLRTPTPHLRWVTVTGGKLPVDRIEQLRRAKPELEIHIAYGQTECAPRATALHPARIDGKPDSVGSPIPGVRVLLLDEIGTEVPSGQVGEVVIEGPNVMVGYWNQPEATARVVDEQGRLHTGDLGRFDADGDLFLVGRKNTMIKSAGERIFPEELEKILLSHQAVREAVVIGVPDPLYGERVEAHVSVNGDGAQPDEQSLIQSIRTLCQSKVPFSRAPKAYHVWAEMPRRPNGKIDRQRLRETAGEIAPGAE